MTQRTTRVFDTMQELCSAVATDMQSVIAADVTARGECHIVLTGGTVGIAVLRDIDSSNDAIDWTHVHVWWGDERFVESHSADRNDGQAAKALLGRIPIPAENVHRMPAAREDGLSLDEAARSYAAELSEFFGADFPRFDLVLLGVGPDAHVASLFPGLPGISVSGQTVIAVRDSPKPPPERISLSLPSINSSRRVWVVASGDDKAEAIHLATTSRDPNVAPVSAVGGSEETCLYVDASAASKI
jgi:6-phosphogluconolactonase